MSADPKLIVGLQAAWKREMAGAKTYRALAQRAPTKQQREVFAVLKERLAVQKARFEEILKTDLPAFNKRLADKNIPGIVVPEK